MNMPRLRLIRFLAPLLLAGGLCAAPETDPMESGEKAAGEWIKVRLETARLESAWLSDRPLLESTVNGLKERAATLEEKRDNLTAKTAKDRAEIDSLQAKDKAAADDLAAADARLKVLVGKIVELRPMLPPRLSEALDLSYKSLEGPGLATGERMQLATTLLSRCSQFNRLISSGEEVLTIPGEEGAKSLEVIYWGLSFGYALDRPAGKVWYGSPGPQGWQWTPRPEAVAPVTKLIAIYNDKADPDFVVLPATLGHTATDGSTK